MGKTERKLLTAVTFVGLLLVFFQNCGDVKIQRNNASSVTPPVNVNGPPNVEEPAATAECEKKSVLVKNFGTSTIAAYAKNGPFYSRSLAIRDKLIFLHMHLTGVLNFSIF